MVSSRRRYVHSTSELVLAESEGNTKGGDDRSTADTARGYDSQYDPIARQEKDIPAGLNGCGTRPAAVKFWKCHSGAASFFQVQKIQPAPFSNAAICALMKFWMLSFSASLSPATVPTDLRAQSPM